MGNAKQEPESEELEQKKKGGWKEGRESEGSSKGNATADQPSKGLRSQGSINVVPATSGKSGEQGKGRRNEPTRHDAMEIAGHERLPGYGTPKDEGAMPGQQKDGGPKGGPGFSKEAPEMEPMAVPEVPDLKEVSLDADRELKHSAEDAESERAEETDQASEAEPMGEEKERNAKNLDEDAGDAEESKG